MQVVGAGQQVDASRTRSAPVDAVAALCWPLDVAVSILPVQRLSAMVWRVQHELLPVGDPAPRRSQRFAPMPAASLELAVSDPF